MSRVPTYSAYIDWYGHGGLAAGLNNWLYEDDLAVELSSEVSFSGHDVIKVTTVSSAFKNIHRPTNVNPDMTIHVELWLWVPDGALPVEVHAIGTGGTTQEIGETATTGQWEKLSADITEPDVLQGPVMHLRARQFDSGDSYYIGWYRVIGEEDDVSCDLLSTRQVPSMQYGRDSARDLDGIRQGQMTAEFRNETSKYTPGNAASPVAEYLKPGRNIVITVEDVVDGVDDIRVLYSGYWDEYELNAAPDEQSVSISCNDLLARLAEIDVSTDLYPSIRTGEAIKAIQTDAALDPPAKGDWHADNTTQFNPFVESGATVLRWWGFAGKALDGIKQLTSAEGPPSLYTVGQSNQLVFHDRVHRHRSDYPTSEEAEFVECKTTGKFVVDDTSVVDYGLDDVVNKVEASYSNTALAGDYTDVWTAEETGTWGANSISDGDRNDYFQFTGTVNGGFYDAQDPVAGVLQFTEEANPDETNVQSGILPEDHDYVDKYDNTVFIDTTDRPMTRNGTEISAWFQHDGAVGELSEVQDLSIRARAVESETATIEKQDDASQAEVGFLKSLDVDMGPATKNDADAVASLVLRNRSIRRPTVTISVVNRDESYIDMQLGIKLGSLIRVNVDRWFIDDLFTVEAIEHRPEHIGKAHRTILHCEQRILDITDGTAFTFDDPDRGFDQGVFAGEEISPDNVFILGESSLDGTDVLTY